MRRGQQAKKPIPEDYINILKKSNKMLRLQKLLKRQERVKNLIKRNLRYQKGAFSATKDRPDQPIITNSFDIDIPKIHIAGKEDIYHFYEKPKDYYKRIEMEQGFDGEDNQPDYEYEKNFPYKNMIPIIPDNPNDKILSSEQRRYQQSIMNKKLKSLDEIKKMYNVGKDPEYKRGPGAQADAQLKNDPSKLRNLINNQPMDVQFMDPSEKKIEDNLDAIYVAKESKVPSESTPANTNPPESEEDDDDDDDFESVKTPPVDQIGLPMDYSLPVHIPTSKKPVHVPNHKSENESESINKNMNHVFDDAVMYSVD